MMLMGSILPATHCPPLPTSALTVTLGFTSHSWVRPPFSWLPCGPWRVQLMSLCTSNQLPKVPNKSVGVGWG